jgi:hypothetical protein
MTPPYFPARRGYLGLRRGGACITRDGSSSSFVSGGLPTSARMWLMMFSRIDSPRPMTLPLNGRKSSIGTSICMQWMPGLRSPINTLLDFLALSFFMVCLASIKQIVPSTRFCLTTPYHVDMVNRANHSNVNLIVVKLCR